MNALPPSDGTDFETHRAYLTGLAYRMLGSVAEAEDVVQDAYLRWHAVRPERIDRPRGFLSKTVTRLCLDRLKSARARRESYTGPWLPEPLLDAPPLSAPAATELGRDLSFALLMALERLSPLERAAFILHDIFDMEFAEVAQVLDRGQAACRQLAARARVRVRSARPRFRPSPDQHRRIAAAFAQAALKGDPSELARLLAQDVVLYSDGGGKAAAALRPITGRDRVSRFIAGLVRKLPAAGGIRIRPQPINGLPGFVIGFADGSLQTVALEALGAEVAAIYIVRNPDKLRHVSY